MQYTPHSMGGMNNLSAEVAAADKYSSSVRFFTVRAVQGRLGGISIFHRKQYLYGGLLYGRAGRVTARNGGFWRGQVGMGTACAPRPGDNGTDCSRPFADLAPAAAPPGGPCICPSAFRGVGLAPTPWGWPGSG